MRNDTHKWLSPIPPDQKAIIGTGIELRVREAPRQMLISGAFEVALQYAQLSEAYGWPDVVSDERHALRLRRDRILVVNGPNMECGWHEAEGIAITDASSVYGIVELQGAAALELLQSGTEIDLRHPSASVMRKWHGINCMIVATGDQSIRLHVPRSYLSYVWDMLEAQAQITLLVPKAHEAAGGIMAMSSGDG